MKRLQNRVEIKERYTGMWSIWNKEVTKSKRERIIEKEYIVLADENKKQKIGIKERYKEEWGQYEKRSNKIKERKKITEKKWKEKSRKRTSESKNDL